MSQRTIDRFSREYRDKHNIYLSRKILAGRRMHLSLQDIAKALDVPIQDVEDAWDTILQDAR